MKRILKFLGLCVLTVFIYGGFFRPALSSKVIRDETVVIPYGSVKVYDMAIPFTRTIILKYEVQAGPPVDVYLVRTDTIQPGVRQWETVPAFAAQATVSGKTDAIVASGRWSVVIMPTGVSSNTQSTVAIATKIQRPRFFGRPNELHSIDVPRQLTGAVQPAPHGY